MTKPQSRKSPAGRRRKSPAGRRRKSPAGRRRKSSAGRRRRKSPAGRRRRKSPAGRRRRKSPAGRRRRKSPAGRRKSPAGRRRRKSPAGRRRRKSSAGRSRGGGIFSAFRGTFRKNSDEAAHRPSLRDLYNDRSPWVLPGVAAPRHYRRLPRPQRARRQRRNVASLDEKRKSARDYESVKGLEALGDVNARRLCRDVFECDAGQKWRRCYKQRALEHHPDKGGDADIFKKLGDCNERLRD